VQAAGGGGVDRAQQLAGDPAPGLSWRLGQDVQNVGGDGEADQQRYGPADAAVSRPTTRRVVLGESPVEATYSRTA
jgi:hypothetical protein